MSFTKPQSFARLNRGHPHAEGLLHAWIPNGNQSGLVLDLAQGSDLDLTFAPVSGSAAFGTPGFAGHRASFTGAHRGANNTSAPFVSPPFTVLVLAERDDVSGAGTFFSHDSGNNGYRLDSNGSTLRFTLGAVANYNTFASVLTAAVPFIYAVRMDVDGGDIVAYYKDFESGNTISRATVDVGSISGTPTAVRVANFSSGSETLDGHIYASLLWDREVFDEEMAGLFHDPYAMWRTAPPIYLFQSAAPPVVPGGFKVQHHYHNLLGGAAR